MSEYSPNEFYPNPAYLEALARSTVRVSLLDEKTAERMAGHKRVAEPRGYADESFVGARAFASNALPLRRRLLAYHERAEIIFQATLMSVVSPYSSATLLSLLQHPDVTDVEVTGCGTECFMLAIYVHSSSRLKDSHLRVPIPVDPEQRDKLLFVAGSVEGLRLVTAYLSKLFREVVQPTVYAPFTTPVDVDSALKEHSEDPVAYLLRWSTP